MVIPSFCGNPKNKEAKFNNLDVRRCMIEYIECTKEESPNKGKRASKNTIVRWMKSAIIEAYKTPSLPPPTGVNAHSTRAVITSWAERVGASPLQIYKAATWSSFHTFVKHYRLDLLANQDQSFGRKVLQAVVPP